MQVWNRRYSIGVAIPRRDLEGKSARERVREFDRDTEGGRERK